MIRYFLVVTMMLMAFGQLEAKGCKCGKAYFPVVVKNVTGEEIEIKVRHNHTIESVKHQIFGKTGIVPEKQIIVLRGRQLDNKKKMQDYGMKGGMTVNLIEYGEKINRK